MGVTIKWTAIISKRGLQIPATYFPPGYICMYIYILQAHFHDSNYSGFFNIQIKYFLFVCPMKMIWVPAMCQTAVHPTFTGCIDQRTENNGFYGAYKLVKADKQ